MNKYKVEFTCKAKKDILRIVSYIANDLKEEIIAAEYKDLFIKEAESLSEFPKRNSPAKGKVPKDTERRKKCVKNYFIFYLVNDLDRVVTIERVLYGASDWMRYY